MILFFNTYLTPTTLKHSYNRGLLHNDNKVDVFKYSIASIAPLQKWSHVIIQFELAPEFQSRYGELVKFIKQQFSNQPNLFIRPGFRNTTQKQWQKTVEELDLTEEKVVFFSCNHDHIFMDSQTDYLNYVVETFRKYQDEYSVMFLSGFWESVEHLKYFQFEFDGPLIKRKLNVHDGFLLVTKSLLKEWWCTIDLGDAYLPRTDEIRKLRDESLMYNFFITSRDIAAHYDGYHNVTTDKSHYLKHCPPITIPKDFFTNDIVINYNNGIKDGVSIDWTKEEFKTTDPNGSDYFYLLKELPLVWKNRIKQINNNIPYNIDFETNFHYRMNFFEKCLKFYTNKNSKEYPYLYKQNENFIQWLYGKKSNFLNYEKSS